MPYLIGTDEAGYGPNYGPLCVSATVWEVADGIDCVALYKLLRKVVANCVERANKKRVVWADSKAVYKGGNGKDHLERGVMAALALVGRTPAQWCELWDGFISRPSSPTAVDEEVSVPVECEDAFTELPWHVGYSASLPFWMGESDWMTAEHLVALSDCLRDGLAAAGVRLVDVLCRAVFPTEFNEFVSASNKADALSRVTLGLVRDAMKTIDDPTIHVFCDKHGGRDKYLPLIQSQFCDDWVEVRAEGSEASVYRFASDGRRVEIGFYVSGERFLPVALASMTAKYMRETAMRPFNEFWCARVPGLKPTAGYPSDSRRFQKQIAGVQRELGIEDRIIWRCR
jgi:hypothetical protein